MQRSLASSAASIRWPACSRPRLPVQQHRRPNRSCRRSSRPPATFTAASACQARSVTRPTTRAAGHAFVTETTGHRLRPDRVGPTSPIATTTRPAASCATSTATLTIAPPRPRRRAHRSSTSSAFARGPRRAARPRRRGRSSRAAGLPRLPGLPRPCRVPRLRSAALRGRQAQVREGHAAIAEWADGNRLIVLFPQVKATATASIPAACWDWWGYTRRATT